MPSVNEKRSIRRTVEVLNCYDLCFVVPQTMDLSDYKEFAQCTVKRFPDKFFRNLDSYSRLMLSTNFYSRFIEYKYMLIAQPDTYILRNDLKYLERIMDYGYDYIGAPWKPGNQLYPLMSKGMTLVRKICKPSFSVVGNGGFCLRKIEPTIRLLKKKYWISRIWKYPEDYFFGYYGSNEKSFYKNAPVEIARKFALEKGAKEEIEKGNIPFALHAWEKWTGDWDFIQQYII